MSFSFTRRFMSPKENPRGSRRNKARSAVRTTRSIRLKFDELEDRVTPTVSFLDPNAMANELVGYSVASVGGGNVLVGGIGVNGFMGAAYLYNSSGTLLQTFTDPDATAYDFFGSSLAADGSNVLVGAEGVNNGSGAAYLYNASGTLLQTFTDPDATAYDSFGISVASDGSNVLVGAEGVNDSRGAAYLYNASGTLLQTFTDPNATGFDAFGTSVALDGSNVLVGAEGVNGSMGAAYLYNASGTLLQTFTDPNAITADSFGDSVASDGSNVLVGAYGVNSESGAAYLYSNVAGAVLTATATPVTTAVYDTAFSGEVATFTDSNPAAPLSDFPPANVTINWGDGTTSSATSVTQPGGIGTPFDVFGSHTYGAAGATATPLTVSIDGDGSVSNTTSYTPTVAKASSATTVTDAGGTYDGTTIFAATAGTTTSDGLTPAPILDYYDNTPSTDEGSTAPVGAGNYTVTATYAGDANHAGSSATATFDVLKATSTTTTAGAGPFTYTGSAQIGGSGTVTGANLSTGASSLTYSANADGSGTADLTDAGTYYVTAHFAGDANHLASDGAAVAITINQANQTITWSNPAGITYGTALSATQLNATVAGLAGGASPGALTYGPLSGAVLNAGSEQNLTVNAAATLDYAAATQTVLINVAQAPLTVVATNQTQTYDSQVFPLTVYYIGFVNNDNSTSAGITGTATFSGSAVTAVSASTTPYDIHVATIGTLQAANYTFTSSTVDGTLTINPAPLTVGGITAANKVYSGTTAATLSTANAYLTGMVSTDSGAVALHASAATGTFASINVGAGITVSIAGVTITGTKAANYTLVQPTTTANITAKSLTVSGITAANKVYDGTTTATLNTASASLSSVLSGDTVTLIATGATGTFASQNVGTGITVAVAGLTLSGASAGNYMVTQPTTKASITAKTLTVAGITANNKVYDGTTTATLSTPGATLSGVVSGDTVTLVTSGATGTFASKNVGTGTVTVAGLTLSGTSAGNYVLTQPATTASITAKTLTVSGITANNKVYDGTTTATLNTASATLIGVVSGDKVTLVTSGVAASFASANVGTGLAVTLAGNLTLGGASGGNYALAQPTGLSANITPASPSFSHLSSPSIVDGSPATISGHVGAGALNAVGSVNITITLGSTVIVSVTATIDSNGNFTASFSPEWPTTGTYTVTYQYMGSTNFNASPNGSTTLKVTGKGGGLSA